MYYARVAFGEFDLGTAASPVVRDRDGERDGERRREIEREGERVRERQRRRRKFTTIHNNVFVCENDCRPPGITQCHTYYTTRLLCRKHFTRHSVSRRSVPVVPDARRRDLVVMVCVCSYLFSTPSSSSYCSSSSSFICPFVRFTTLCTLCVQYDRAHNEFDYSRAAGRIAMRHLEN